MATDPSPRSAAEQLREVERRRIEVYTSQTTPPWAWPVFGLAMGVNLATFELDSRPVRIAVVLVWAVVVGAWAGAVLRRSGVQPRLRGMPRPLLHEMWRFWAAGLLVALVVVGVGVVSSFLLAGVVAAVAVTLGGTWAERRYRRVAARLASPPSPT